MGAAMLTLMLIIAILAMLYAFVAICAAIFNWMHAGTADFWEVLFDVPYEDRKYK